jgi:hypothetical protein
MRALASMVLFAAITLAAITLAAPASSASLTCATNCESRCFRCQASDCSLDRVCVADCQARKKAICQAFPDPSLPEFKFETWGGILGPNGFVVPGLNGEIEKWTHAQQPPTVPLPDAAPVQPAAPPGSPPAGPSPPKPDDEAQRPKIIDTRSAALVHPGDEAAGYGLYTYVLLRESADRDSDFLKDIVESAPSASGVAPPLRPQIDLMLIPANPCPAASAKSAADCKAHLVDNVARDLKGAYNYEESNALLEELCAKPPEKLAEFCGKPIGQGPFLFTYARPVSTMNPIPPPFLFFDFTEEDDAAFADYIEAYEGVLKSDDFTDDSKLKTLRLEILNVFNRARAAAGPTTGGAVKLVHLFYPGGED